VIDGEIDRSASSATLLRRERPERPDPVRPVISDCPKGVRAKTQSILQMAGMLEAPAGRQGTDEAMNPFA